MGIFSQRVAAYNNNLALLPRLRTADTFCLLGRGMHKKSPTSKGSRTLYKVWAILLSLQTDRVIALLHRHQFAERLRRAIVSRCNDAGSRLNRLGQATGLAGRRKLLAGQRTPFVFRVLRDREGNISLVGPRLCLLDRKLPCP